VSETSAHYFICGIGGSGMLPLAVILKGMGHRVSGSDRSFDQGRTPEKFDWIRAQGIALHPQDGSGITAGLSAVVISKAVESTVPDIAAAQRLDLAIRMRVDLLIDLFNAAPRRLAIAGTSGKTTTTGMTGFILRQAGLDPTVMNGGIFRNFAKENPYATAFVGKGRVFVSEIDESDGIEAVTRFKPEIAVLHNVTLDHQPMEYLTQMFEGFLSGTGTALLNAEDANVRKVAKNFGGRIITYSADETITADLYARSIDLRPDGIEADVFFRNEKARLKLAVPGRHNLSNALAAIASAMEFGIGLEQSCAILADFTGIKRRMEIVGAARGVTVIDDFAHNPDKIAATLETLKSFPGRVLLFFQPHGYGFLKVVGPELGQAFASCMDENDQLYMVEPFYAGGTVDRSVGSASIVADIVERGRHAYLVESRDAAMAALLADAKAGDRIVVMGARDDTLSDFARAILHSLTR
jgi:UDP-N-acetylmuramate--alanine ligase